MLPEEVKTWLEAPTLENIDPEVQTWLATAATGETKESPIVAEALAFVEWRQMQKLIFLGMCLRQIKMSWDKEETECKERNNWVTNPPVREIQHLGWEKALSEDKDVWQMASDLMPTKTEVPEPPTIDLEPGKKYELSKEGLRELSLEETEKLKSKTE